MLFHGLPCVMSIGEFNFLNNVFTSSFLKYFSKNLYVIRCLITPNIYYNTLFCQIQEGKCIGFKKWVYFCPLRLRNGSFHSHISAESLPKTHPYLETYLEFHQNAATGKAKGKKMNFKKSRGCIFCFFVAVLQGGVNLFTYPEAQSEEKI